MQCNARGHNKGRENKANSNSRIVRGVDEEKGRGGGRRLYGINRFWHSQVSCWILDLRGCSRNEEGCS